MADPELSRSRARCRRSSVPWVIVLSSSSSWGIHAWLACSSSPHRVGAPNVTASRLTWLIVDLELPGRASVWDGLPSHKSGPMQAYLHAQRAWFTIHGDKFVAMESVPTHRRCLEKVTLPFAAIKAAKRFLQVSGIDHYLLFADLESLSLHLKEKNGLVSRSQAEAAAKRRSQNREGPVQTGFRAATTERTCSSSRTMTQMTSAQQSSSARVLARDRGNFISHGIVQCAAKHLRPSAASAVP